MLRLVNDRVDRDPGLRKGPTKEFDGLQAALFGDRRPKGWRGPCGDP
jgi:hypothetical protein